MKIDKKAFLDLFMDKIYLIGNKEDDKYTLTLTQAEAAAKELYDEVYSSPERVLPDNEPELTTPDLDKEQQNDEFVAGICKRLTMYYLEHYPNSVFYMDGATLMFEHEQDKDNMLWVRCDKFWPTLSENCLGFDHMQQTAKVLLEKHLQLKNIRVGTRWTVQEPTK